MMKCALVLVLLQICFCFQLDMNLNGEIMKHLSGLNLNSSVQQNVPVPGHYMRSNPSNCVSTFSRELNNILKNIAHRFMTAETKLNIQSLQANLRKLGKDQMDDDKCIMDRLNLKHSGWIGNYIKFLKKLNSSGVKFAA